MSKPLIFFRFKIVESVLQNLDENPKEFLYGAAKLIAHNRVNAVFSNKQRSTILRKLLYFVEKPFTKIYLLGMPLEIVFENFKEVRNSSVIMCVNDAISFAVLFFKKIGVLNAPVITLFQSLPERRLRYFSQIPFATYLVRTLLKESDHVLVLSSAAKWEMIKAFGVDINNVEIFHFGTDLSFWKAAGFDDRENFILSVGNDHNRDYQTLISALPDRVRLKVVTQKPIPQSNHVEVLNGLDNKELRSLYQRALMVVTPSRKILNESSGLSSTLQAMACGAPVVVSDSLPMRELFGHKQAVSFYEPENPDSLRSKIELLMASKKEREVLSKRGQELVRSNYNVEEMERKLKRIFAQKSKSGFH